MNICRKGILFLGTLLGILSICPINSNAEATINYRDYYNTTYGSALKTKTISKTVSLEEFKKHCDTDISPQYRNFIKHGGTIGFPEFAYDNGFGYAPHLNNPINIINKSYTQVKDGLALNLTAHRPSSLMNYKMKPGDILICYGSDSSGEYLGHAAIAYSSKKILHMPGGLGAKHNAKLWSKNKFFNKYATSKKKYVIVYRIKKHTVYARRAAHYAFNKMYHTVNPTYFTTMNLYHKNPSYCSKYVYLSFWWGDHHRGLKKHLIWIFPHTEKNIFKGSYKPKSIYKIE